MITLGIDPGLSGAIAVLDGDQLRAAHDIPAVQIRAKGREVDLPNLAQIFDAICSSEAPAACWVEDVSAMPEQGIASAFRFGETLGALRGMAAAHFIPLFRVRPNIWKRGIPAGKDAARGLASSTWPTMSEHFRLVKHADRAEAALIALYGYRQTARKIET